MRDLEVRQLRYFVAVAEELNFGRAAERLGIAQPPLSRAISQLERQLGVRLLERSRRHVAMTAAGSVLLEEARTALAAVEAAGRRAQDAGRSQPTLRVALKADYDAGLLPEILETYRAMPDAMPVELVLGGLGDQTLALRAGRADVAMIPTPFDEAGLDVEPLLTEERVVALKADDPLAARTVLSLADLAGRQLPDGAPADQGVHSAPYDGSVDGAPGPALDLAKIFNLVEIGAIVWFPPASIVRRHPRPHVAYRPVVDLPPTTFTLAWPQTSRSRAVADFLLAATTVARNAELEAATSMVGYPS